MQKGKKAILLEDFIFALTANDKNFEKRKKYFDELGIVRLDAFSMLEYHKYVSGFNHLSFPAETKFTICNNIEVIEATEISFDKRISNLFIIDSLLPNIKFSVLDESDKQETKNEVWISNSSIGELFLSNTSLRNLQIQNSTIDTVMINRAIIYNLTCQKNTVLQNLYINDESHISTLSLYNNTISNFSSDYSSIDKFNLTNSTIRGIYLNNTLSGKFEISSSTVNNIRFDEHCTFDSVSLIRITSKDIYFNGSNYIGQLSIIGSQTGKITYFRPCSSDTIEIVESIIDGLYLENGHINRLRLIKSTFQDINIRHCTLIVSELNNIRCKNTFFEFCTFYSLSLCYNLEKDNLLTFSNSKFWKISLNYFSSVLGYLFFRKTDMAIFRQHIRTFDPLIKHDHTFEEKRKSHIYNFGQNISKNRIELTNELLSFNSKPTFILNQSSLGKAEFTDCDLANFDFKFNNSKITEIFISGGSVPSENIQIFNVEQNTLAWHEQKVSAYSQLKKVFDSQGDIFWSSHFQSKTGKHQSKVLELRLQQEANQAKSWNDKVTNLFSTNRFDLISFQLNHYSNLHGENWGRALAFTLLLPMYLYITYLLSLGKEFSLKNSIDWNVIGYFFTFIDPTHKIDFWVESKSLNGWARFIDFLSRIVVSYGIYQLIVAFRKHGKKT